MKIKRKRNQIIVHNEELMKSGVNQWIVESKCLLMPLK